MSVPLPIDISSYGILLGLNDIRCQCKGIIDSQESSLHLEMRTLQGEIRDQVNQVIRVNLSDS